ncbi:MAG TPA: DUF481 domain-containing protein [Elusimicrobiota bacterium]|nr:DUF481 domain-containing protein [Elusimicrobiota bacterium]
MKKSLFLILGAILVVSLNERPRAEENPTKKWSNKTQISYLSANGNTKSTTLGAADEFEYRWTRWILNINAGGLGSQSARVVTAEQYYANEKMSFKLSDRNYTFEKSGWDKNRFAGIANRIDSSVGLGREIVKTPRNHWILELGGGYVNEQRIRSERETFSSGRAYTKYAFNFSPTSQFSQDAEYLHNFERAKGYRVNAETALVSAMSAHMSLKVSYLVKHVNEPAPGFGRNDTLTSAALLFNY